MKVQIRRAAACFLGMITGVGVAATYEVSNSDSLSLETGDVVSAVTADIPDVLPDVGSTPLFHLDASQTNGWVFASGTNAVTKIPSLVGSRYLYVKPNQNFWNQLPRGKDGSATWDATDYWTPCAPQFKVGALNGKPVVDFGKQGSKECLFFDYQGDDPEGVAFTPTNQLRGIGTVIAVWNSENGGGHILGGGIGMSAGAENRGYMWARGRSYSVSTPPYSNGFETNITAQGSVFYMSKLSTGGNAAAYNSAVKGTVRHDGFTSVPGTTGFNGGWEIVTVTPTDALGTATGLGQGFVTINVSTASGGMKIAEMLIYPDLLSSDAAQAVEEYLAKKWLVRAPRGKEGNAHLGKASAPRVNSTDGSQISFDVPAGETLAVDSIPYGRGKDASVTKTGAGTLALGDVRRYTGKVRVDEGTIRFATKATPMNYPAKPLFLLDASRSDLIATTATNGTNFVSYALSASDRARSGKKILARSVSDTTRPFLATNMFFDVNGSSSPVLDFYDRVRVGGNSPDGGLLKLGFWSDDPTSCENGYLYNISTVLAVIAPRGKGGTLLGTTGQAADPSSESSTACYFDRDQDTTASWGTYTKPLLGVKPISRIHTTLAPTNAILMIDGEKRDVRSGYDTRGFQVIAIQTQGSMVNAIGSSFNASYNGGFMLAELALFDRDFTEDELRDASAYLYAKWFKRALPGYDRAVSEAELPDVQNLEMADGTAIDVPSGTVARVANLKLDGALVKTGAGGLEIVTSDGMPFPDVRVAGGFVRLVGQPSTSSATDYAHGASIHLDASDISKMELPNGPVNGKDVNVWYDKYHRNVATWGNTAPKLNLEGALPPTGLPVVDFGDFRSYRRMAFRKPLNSVRSAFIVLGTQTGKGGMILGTVQTADPVSTNFVDFHFAKDGSGWPNGPFINPSGTKSVRTISGTQYLVDGTNVVYTAVRYPTDGETYNLYEIHLPVGAHVSGLCCNGTDYLYSGGLRIGEVMLFERELTDREKVATRNYLMKKWLGKTDEELQPLPDAPEVPTSVSTLNLGVEDGDVLEIQPDDPLTASYLVGEGNVTKSGAGVLSIGDVVGFTGTVSVAEGILKVTSARPNFEPRLPAPENRLVHVDASRGLQVASFANDGSLKRIMGWENLAGSGWTVTNKGSSASAHPYAYADNTLGGRTVVKFDQSSTTGLRFVNPEGVQTNMYNMKSGLFILGAHEGGGFLLGGGETSNATSGVVSPKDCFHRGTVTYGDRHTDNLLYSGACDAARTAEYWVNVTNYLFDSQKTKPNVYSPMETNFYNNAWNSVAFRFTTIYGKIEAVGGFAYHNSVLDRNGSQRLAEVVLYDKRLTDDELALGQAYLRIKWGLDAFQRSMTNHVSVALAAGAALDLGGTNQYFECVSGAGVVSNGTLSVSKLVADPLVAPLTLDGTFSASEGMEVEISNFSSVGPDCLIPVVACAAVENRSLLRSAVFTGDMSWAGRYKAKLVYADGVLSVKFVPRGMILIVE